LSLEGATTDRLDIIATAEFLKNPMAFGKIVFKDGPVVKFPQRPQSNPAK
jgi:hypothetical protein